MNTNFTTPTTPKGQSYRCDKQQVFNLTNIKDSKEIVGTVSISRVQLQAFHNKNDNQFEPAIDCEAVIETTSYLVPILCVSVLLIVIVLIVLMFFAKRGSLNLKFLRPF